jgi:hypothetical protein
MGGLMFGRAKSRSRVTAGLSSVREAALDAGVAEDLVEGNH